MYVSMYVLLVHHHPIYHYHIQGPWAGVEGFECRQVTPLLVHLTIFSFFFSIHFSIYQHIQGPWAGVEGFECRQVTPLLVSMIMAIEKDNTKGTLAARCHAAVIKREPMLVGIDGWVLDGWMDRFWMDGWMDG